MNPLIIAAISITLCVAVLFELKAGMSRAEITAVMAQPHALHSLFAVLTDKHVFLGFLLYGHGTIVLLGVLSKWDVSKAYSLVGMGLAFTVGIGFMIEEGITFNRVTSVAKICARMFLDGWS